MSQLSRLLSRTCDYAIIIQVYKAYLPFTRSDNLIVVSADIDLGLDEDFTNYKTLLTTPTFRVDDNGFCTIDTALCYFVSKRGLARLWNTNSTIHLTLKQDNGSSIGRSYTFEFDLASCVKWIDNGQEGRMDRINHYLNKHNSWCSPTTNSNTASSSSATAIKLQAGLFVVGMPGDKQRTTNESAPFEKATLSNTSYFINQPEQQPSNILEPNTRSGKRFSFSQQWTAKQTGNTRTSVKSKHATYHSGHSLFANYRSLYHEMYPSCQQPRANTVTSNTRTYEKLNSLNDCSLQQAVEKKRDSQYDRIQTPRWRERRNASILDFDPAEIHALRESIRLQDKLPQHNNKQTAPSHMQKRNSVQHTHSKLTVNIDVDEEDEDGQSLRTPLTPTPFDRWSKLEAAVKTTKRNTVGSRYSDL